MKIKIIATVLILLFCGTMVSAQNNTKSNKKQPGHVKKELQKDSVYYTCSSHPEIRQENPGLCPKCGLILEEKTVSKTKNQKKGMNKQYSCKMHPEVCMDKQGHCPKCGELLVKKTSQNTDTKTADKDVVKTYTCTMHPEVIKDKPGACPKCGMELVEKKQSVDVK